VFVHGLRGHPQHTWEAVNPDEDADEDNKKIFWPKILLPNTIKECRIFSYGYPTDFVTFYPVVTPGSISRMSIDNHSTSLMLKLGNVRREDNTVRCSDVQLLKNRNINMNLEVNSPDHLCCPLPWRSCHRKWASK
jgi:hypothetical protein